MFLLAGIYAFWLGASAPAGRVRFMRAAFLLYGFAAVMVCLEEVSYGQHFLHFNTPEWFIEYNKNKELNLHNLGQDTPAYALRTAGYAVVSLLGIAAPLFMRFSKAKPARGGLIDSFIPTAWMIVPSLLHLFANVPTNLLILFAGGGQIVDAAYYFEESGEYEEYMLGLWVILYMAATHIKLRVGTAKA